MTTVSFHTTPAFDAGLRGLIAKCGLNAQTVVRKEAGELIKTLVKISPPKNPAQTRQSIAANIRAKFAAAADADNSQAHADQAAGKSGIRWYAMTEAHLYGVAPERDLRAASVGELESLMYRLTGRGYGAGRQEVQFRQPRRRQTVILTQTILAKRKTIAALIRKKQLAVGRLKAGWLVAVSRGVLTMTGSVPQWISRHAAGARGRFVNGLNDKVNPRIEIANSAKGIGAPTLRPLIASAMKIRAKAMRANALLFARGKKQLSSYA